MAKTQKELAFLRDLYINTEWTRRFTDLIDKHVKLVGDENLLYINAGTGDHVTELREKLREEVSVFATCENEDLLMIARDKAEVLKADIEFSLMHFSEDAFDEVIADGTLMRPATFLDFVNDAVRVAREGAKVAIILPTAGSFGEIFSLLWEVFFNGSYDESGAEVEAMIASLPSVSLIEEVAATAGLINVETHTAIEVFEFETGEEFISSTLVADYLLPQWLDTLSEKEKEQVPEKLAQLIDEEEGTISFRFSVKATLLTGEKEYLN